jgi:hypothetical protein
MNLSKLTTAVALSVASIGAHAAIASTSPGSELFFFAYGDAAKQTFAFDTGLSVATFTPAAATSNLSFDLNAQGASFNAFRAANPDAVWGLLAADTSGSAATANTRRTTATVTNGAAASLIASPWTGAGSINTFITGTNALPSGESTHGSQANGASIHTTVDALDTASWLQSINATLNGTMENALISAALNESLLFKTWTNAAGGAPVGVQYLQTDGTTAAFWNVLSTGADSTLSFTAVAPIPEPSDLAFMVAGLSLAGAIARRRKKLA